ncbi:UDP-N-acetylmuramoyl-tripeptide--D-alanyl-D-alanine ligase [Paenibacillus sp. JX-17]|uniref:UDP-N-acetylmuramoyl-tripeptide--D-alanyl-D-alanine ligase n=1 Tax=Paenibacillus lacisoli TaxID=3064525 RepID=A0ABT9CA33_9BACL|nr:UDP-N-acetylmuramoyl-tripeptide--D-alanyl-D-alanine ligase [Paenibacillus sp. JX-17]MDO7905408.1 UDP-N-acetylmuramoyl-tripeptide--D-alanyl-D-alanine ligase [Paenibacillus sp. JX-17]
MNRNLGQVARMCGGKLAEGQNPEQMVQGVFTDSRQPQTGSLFVPLVGERFDGHSFVESCLEAGAACALWQEDHGVPPQGSVILVEDTLVALQKLASAYLSESRAKVVAITGSNGKTTTKDMVYALLASTFKVHKTQGNFNNHIGLPLTVLAMEEDCDHIILEMGMSGRQEIAVLSAIAKPDVAVITNIGESHLLQLGSRLEIARAKLEITTGLKDGGLLIFNGDEPLLHQVLAEVETVKPEHLRPQTFGLEQSNNYYPSEIEYHSDSTEFVSNLTEGLRIRLPLLGQHNVINALAAIAAARCCGVPVERLAGALESLKLTGMRIERTVTEHGLTLLNDAYNASPTSMRAAIDALHGLSPEGRRVAVLGDMLELGSDEESFHEEMGRYLSSGKVDLLFTYGRLGACIAKGARQVMPDKDIMVFSDKEELTASLMSNLRAGDVVLVKASRGMRLEEVVETLKQ